jgi:molybdenum cofactor cytidylyltransferase
VIAGLWSSHPQSDGVVFVAEDLPLVRTELINSLIERFENSAAWIVAASFGGQPSNPILFRRDLFPELLELTGNDKGYSLLNKHAKKTALVERQDENSYVNGESRRASERLKERV